MSVSLIRSARRRRLASGLCLVIAGSIAFPVDAVVAQVKPAQPKSTPASSPTVTFGVQPASGAKGEVKPDARGLFAYGVTPGGLINDSVAFRNYSAAPITVRVYATDAQPTTDGEFALLGSRDKAVDVGSWVSIVGVRGGQVVVPAQSYKVFPLRMQVPRDAQPGDHTGAVVASYDSVSKNKDGVNVRLEQRVGSRLKVRVTGPLRPKLLVENMSASFEKPGNPFGKGKVRVSYKVSNVGNVRLAGLQSVRVQGWLGAKALARDLPPVPELMPGSSYAVSTELDVRAAGRLTVAAEVVPVTPPGDPALELTLVRSKLGLWAFTWGWLIVVAAVLLVGQRSWRRRRARRLFVAAAGSPATAKPVPVASTPSASAE